MNRYSIIPEGLHQLSDAAPLRESQDLHCGDIFLFRDQTYVCLSNSTDQRHASTILTTINQRDAATPLQKITVLRLFRTFEVKVLNHIPLEIHVLANSEEEVKCVARNPVYDRNSESS